MIRTFRKVELLAAAFYAASFVLWSYEAPGPKAEEDLRCGFCLLEKVGLMTITGRESACIALLIIAVGLTVAAVRLRRTEPHHS